MRKIILKGTFLLLLTLNLDLASAQTTITGTITDELTGEPLIGVSILVQGTILGTITDINGAFDLEVTQNPPLTLIVSYVGYTRQEIIVTESPTKLNVLLSESTTMGEEVVVSASRLEESTLKSPVSIQRIDILDIQAAPTADFYGALKSLNGVDFSTQSLTFNSINVRGFGSNGNVRFVQLIDGIDNAAPGLNFPAGNVIGISELDLESIELLPGAASALYGPNALQGALLMRSKSPFDYQGLDMSVKLGVNHVDRRDHELSIYQDYNVRFAKAYKNKFAFKLNASYIEAQDFIGVDYRDQSGATIEENLGSTPENNRLYDGVNLYGEFLTTVGFVADAAIQDDPELAALLEPTRSLYPNGPEGQFVPKGYRESDFVDNTTESLKLNAALHYRVTDKVEAIGDIRFGLGSSVYTANDRFILDGFRSVVGKLELKGSHWFVRGYTNHVNAGDSYAANTAAQLINAEYYLAPYLEAYGAALASGEYASNDYEALHAVAKAAADAVQPDPTSFEFLNSLKNYRNTPISEGGALFLEKSDLYHYEGSYNFINEIDFMDVVVGFNHRIYDLESEGTLFALDDLGEEFSMKEYGTYVQMSKDVIKNLRLQGSIRYDNNQYFKAQFSPRISGVWEFSQDQNIRASFQRGFRIPTTQDQFIDLDVVTQRLLGRNQVIINRYNIESNPVYLEESVRNAQITGNVADLILAEDVYNEYKTEKVSTYELGYKGLLFSGDLLVDFFGFYNIYSDFGANISAVQAVNVANGTPVLTGRDAIPQGFELEEGATEHSDEAKEVFINNGSNNIALQTYSFNVNIEESIESYGAGLSLDYTLGGGYSVGGNVSYNKIRELGSFIENNYEVDFNTPEWKYNLKFGNRKITKNVGFNLSYRWQNAFVWSSAIGEAVIPAFGTVDAQVSYDFPNSNARLKLGGSNILNKRYTTSLANPSMGAIYYVQLNFDNLLN